MKTALLFSLIGIYVSFFQLPSSLQAQDIRFWYTDETKEFAADQFRIDLLRDDSKKSFRVREDEIIFGNGSAMISGFYQASISPDRAFVGALFVQGGYITAEVYRSDGTLLHRIGRLAEHDPSDPSVQISMLGNGSFLYRDNIASFTYFDERGVALFQFFNSAGSLEGEAVSELITAPFGQRVIVVNPRIISGGVAGSRIRVTRFDTEPLSVFVSGNLSIRDVRLHTSGRLLLAHVVDESRNRHFATVLSVWGDILAEIDYEENEIEEVVFSPCGGFLTGRTSGRAIVHDVASGERLGSASFRERVQLASYMPDGNLVVLTGNRSGNRLESIRLHIIDVRQRRVVRERTSLTAHTSAFFPLSLEYEGGSTYRLQGVNREMLIRHSL